MSAACARASRQEQTMCDRCVSDKMAVNVPHAGRPQNPHAGADVRSHVKALHRLRSRCTRLPPPPSSENPAHR